MCSSHGGALKSEQGQPTVSDPYVAQAHSQLPMGAKMQQTFCSNDAYCILGECSALWGQAFAEVRMFNNLAFSVHNDAGAAAWPPSPW